MQIQNITIVVRGSKGEVMKGVFDLEGNCLSGSADIKDVISQAHAALSDIHVDEAEGGDSDDGGFIDASDTVDTVE